MLCVGCRLLCVVSVVCCSAVSLLSLMVVGGVDFFCCWLLVIVRDVSFCCWLLTVGCPVSFVACW